MSKNHRLSCYLLKAITNAFFFSGNRKISNNLQEIQVIPPRIFHCTHIHITRRLIKERNKKDSQRHTCKCEHLIKDPNDNETAIRLNPRLNCHTKGRKRKKEREKKNTACRYATLIFRHPHCLYLQRKIGHARGV